MTVYCVEFDGEADNFNSVFSTLERAQEYVWKVAKFFYWWENFHEEDGGWLYSWYNPYTETDTEYCMISMREIDAIPEILM